jgi:REP element-mobilizing transposase RayT
VPHNRELRQIAKQAVKYPPVIFKGVQARAVARGFAENAERGKITVHACAILPEHVHMVVARHTVPVEKIVALFKANATRQLMVENLHPFAAHRNKRGGVPTCWGENCWKVFLDSPEDIIRAIKYVQHNPVKEGKRPQKWWFVKPYNAFDLAPALGAGRTGCHEKA